MNYLNTADVKRYFDELMRSNFSREEAIQVICAWLRRAKDQ